MTRTYINELISIVQGKAGDTLKQICNEKNRDKVNREFSLLDIIYAKKSMAFYYTRYTQAEQQSDLTPLRRGSPSLGSELKLDWEESPQRLPRVKA